MKCEPGQRIDGMLHWHLIVVWSAFVSVSTSSLHMSGEVPGPCYVCEIDFHRDMALECRLIALWDRLKVEDEPDSDDRLCAAWSEFLESDG